MAPPTGPGRIRLAGRTGCVGTPPRPPRCSPAPAEVGHAWCLCRRPALRLVIRCTRAAATTSRAGPVRANETTPLPNCPFHKLGPGLSGRDRYSKQAIRKADDGVFIRLPASPSPAAWTNPNPPTPRRRTPAPKQAPGAPSACWDCCTGCGNRPSSTSRARRQHVSLTWRTCHARLRQQLRETTINGRAMDEALYVIRPFTPAAADANALDASAHAWGARAQPRDAP